jgi:hypothetical protein
MPINQKIIIIDRIFTDDSSVSNSNREKWEEYKQKYYRSRALFLEYNEISEEDFGNLLNQIKDFFLLEIDIQSKKFKPLNVTTMQPISTDDESNQYQPATYVIEGRGRIPKEFTVIDENNQVFMKATKEKTEKIGSFFNTKGLIVKFTVTDALEVPIGEIRNVIDIRKGTPLGTFEIRDSTEAILANVYFVIRKPGFSFFGSKIQELIQNFYIEISSGNLPCEWVEFKSSVRINVHDPNKRLCFSLDRSKKRMGAFSSQATVISKGTLSPVLTCMTGLAMCAFISGYKLTQVDN